MVVRRAAGASEGIDREGSGACWQAADACSARVQHICSKGRYLILPRLDRQCPFLTGLIFWLAMLLLPGSPVRAAHPVSVTLATVYVSPDVATIKLHVFLEDLYLFHNLQPNDAEFLDRATLDEGIELHKEFICQRLVLRDVSGRQLDGRVVDVEDDELPTEGVPLSELMAHRITFELEYDLPQEVEFLTFSQQFTDDEGMLPSEMKLIVKQENAPAAEEVVLRPDDLRTIRFDWDLPPLPDDASQTDRQQWARQQEQQQLGITSYSSVYSFLYIEEHEVRHEILIPLLTLEQSVLIARDGDEMLDLAEQDAARQQIEAYFQSGNPIEIDGALVTGQPSRCDFYGLDFRDFAMQAQRQSVPIVTARVGVILTYPARTAPQSVRLTWNRFDSYVWAVNTVVFAYDKTIKTTLSRLGNGNLFQWNGAPPPAAPLPQPVPAAPPAAAQIALPWLTLLVGLVGLGVLGILKARRAGRAAFSATLTVFILVAALAWPYAQWVAPLPWNADSELGVAESESVFGALHKNLYRAFEYRSEGEIYDVLARSVSGELLQNIYLQMRKGLVMAEQGGAVARVKDVTIVSGQLADRPAPRGTRSTSRVFAYRCRWNVSGTVEHWGHIHQRTNQYEAIFTIQELDGMWYVTDLELLDDKRLQFETRLRQS